jgi:cytochrome P450
MMQFLSDDMRRNPFGMYDQIRTSSPVVRVAAADLWMIFDYDGVKRALSDHDAFNSSMAAAGRRNPNGSSSSTRRATRACGRSFRAPSPHE